MNTSASRAIFTRNFVNYFASPTGYVFICLYVLLSSIAAFCPYDFFNANLANLDQLNLYFPLIMLVFIPTITMSIWADERRQGTDELLLTIPASDLDIVLGKYLAAVSIFTVALLFSGVSNLAVLAWLGNPDPGLLVATHVGYWLVGVTMLAVGMVASFMTPNLTVAFILGAVLNAPLVAAYWADAVFGPGLADPLRNWSVGHQFADFGRGVISLSGIAFFGMIVVVMLYLSMVLIGQRHWRAPYSAALSWLFHLAIHGALLAAFVVGAWLVFGDHGGVTELSKADTVSAKQEDTVSADGASKADATSEEQEPATPLPVERRDLSASPKALSLGVFCGLVLFYLLLQTGILWIWHAAMPDGIGTTMPGHYLLRTVVLVIVLGGVAVFFQRHDLRADVTSEQLSSLSPATRELLTKLDVKRPVHIEAFISPEVPESYVQTQLNLRAMLTELDSLGGDKVEVVIRDTEPFSEEAAHAEQLYGIIPRQVASQSRGVWSVERIFMHVAVNCGLQKVDPVFYDRGIPTEYELVRSIATVSQQKRKRIGVVTTDVPLYGQFDFQTGSSTADWPIIDELKKQYEVEQVDLTTPIPADEHYDAILAVQPSSLGPDQMDHLIAAIQEGRPTALFEDPMPYLAAGVPATSEPRRAPGGMEAMFGGGRQAPPKGDRARLWETLGVIFDEKDVVWQDYNPYPKIDTFTQDKEFVFVGRGALATAGNEEESANAKKNDEAEQQASDQSDVFNQADPISSNLQQMLFPFPGSIRPLPSSTASQFTPLVKTGNRTGTIPQDRILTASSPFARPQPDPRRWYLYSDTTNDEYVMAAAIRGKGEAGADDAKTDEAKTDGDAEPAKSQGLHVVLVADIDMLTPAFFRIREEGDVPEADVHFEFDNVPFILNVLDVLADDTRFLELRKRRRVHRTLTRIEEETEKAKEDAAKARATFIEAFNKGRDREQEAFEKKIEDLRNRPNVDPQQMIIEVSLAQDVGERRLNAEIDRLERERDTAVNKIETELNLKTLQVQSSHKMKAALYPLILPMALALAVFFYRRVQEREGVARSRLR